MAHDDKKHYDETMAHETGTEEDVDLVGGEDTRRAAPRHAEPHVEDNAPYNPLSPHADDPAFEPAPARDDETPGFGGEYDQTPYIARQGKEEELPEGKGEYDQEPYIERQAARQPDVPGVRDGREHGERGTRDPNVHDK